MTDLAVGTADQQTTSEDTGLDQAQLEARLESHRVELTGYCYRMLGSSFEAEDAVQDTFVRAWRAYDRFQGRSSLRSWLYRIATNVCFDALDGRQKRARPMDLGPASSADSALGPELPEERWIQPMPDGRVVPEGGDPADLAVQRDSVRLAFLATLQHLPPKQRAVLILREVLQWRATEVASLLETSVASVNSALQRARATLATKDVDDLAPQPALDDQLQGLLARYLDAFERYDLDAMTALLHEDASWSMPPYELWLQTHADIKAWCLGTGHACRGSKLVPIVANGAPGFAQYKPSGPDGAHEAWALQVLQLGSDGKIAGICFYLDTAHIFPLFGLPLTYAEIQHSREPAATG
jgi:RNA polymerase sigma-70 factor (ECF subfamily)